MNDYLEDNGIILPPGQLFIQVPIKFIRNPNYTVKEKLVYMYIWTYGITSKVGFPSQPRMAKELSIGLTSLRQTLDSLEDKNGLLRITRIYEGTNEKATSLYYLGEITEDGSFSNKYLKTILAIYPDRIRYIPKPKPKHNILPKV